MDASARIVSGDFGEDPYLIHPPGYLYLLSALVKPGAGALESARKVNYALFALTGWAVFILGMKMSRARPWSAGLVASSIYFTSPLAIQGTLLIDLGDTSLVPLAAACYFIAAAASRHSISAIAFALNLWTKFIHPLFIAASAAAGLLAGRRDGAGAARFYAVAAGAGIFLLSWYLYAASVLPSGSRWMPFEYMFGEMFLNYHRAEAVSSSLLSMSLTRALELLRVLIWLWPPLLLWGLRVGRRGFGEGAERHMNMFIVLLFAAAALTKGTSNGFPKYHAAILPAVAALGGAFAAEEGLPSVMKTPLLTTALIAVAFFLVLATGDPILALNYEMRKALALGESLSSGAAGLMIGALAALGCIAVFFAALRSEEAGVRLPAAVLAGALSWQSGLALLQYRGDYFTTYGYGTTGKSEVVSLLSERCPGCRVLAPNEFRTELSEAGILTFAPPDTCWQTKACLMGNLRDPGNSAFVYGLSSNTVAQLREFSSLAPGNLGRGFTREQRGDFTILLFDSDGAR